MDFGNFASIKSTLRWLNFSVWQNLRKQLKSMAAEDDLTIQHITKLTWKGATFIWILEALIFLLEFYHITLVVFAIQIPNLTWHISKYSQWQSSRFGKGDGVEWSLLSLINYNSLINFKLFLRNIKQAAQSFINMR